MLAPYRLLLSWLLGLSMLVAVDSATAHGRMKAYLLIAVPELGGTPYYSLKSGETRIDQLRQMFLHRLRALPLDLEVIELADETRLRRVLTSATTAAVFWLGHSVSQAPQGGVGLADTIVDAYGNNVAPLFQQIHPNVRYLAVIGCLSQPILERYRKLGAYSQNSLLRIWSYNGYIEPHGYVEPSIGLNQATVQGYLALAYAQKLYPEIQCAAQTQEGVSLIVSRKSSDQSESSPFQILVNGQLVGFVEKTLPGDEIRHRLWIPKRALTENKFAIEILRGTNESSTFLPTGEIQFYDRFNRITHKIIRKANGQVMGENRRRQVFLPQIELTFEISKGEFECHI